MQRDIYDITIIGGGPSGLFAGFYAGMRQAKTKIIEALPTLGGQLSLLYPEKNIYDVAGFPNIKAQDLINQLMKQMEPFHHTICLDETVHSLLPKSESEDYFTLETNKGVHYTKSVIIAAGNGAFQPRRLTVEGHEALEGHGLHYFINDMKQFENKHIVICGGGDSAVDWSLMLKDTAASVHLLHRRPTFRAHEHSVAQLQRSNVNIKTPFVIDSFLTNEGDLTGLVIYNPKEEVKETIPTTDLIVNYGFSSSIGPIKQWDLTLKGNNIVTESNASTSIPGVFAIGDISTYPGKVELIATGFGEAPIAVNHAIHFINPKARVQPMHSTSLFAQEP